MSNVKFVLPIFLFLALILTSIPALADTVFAGSSNGQLQYIDTSSNTVTTTLTPGSGGSVWPAVNPAQTQLAVSVHSQNCVKIYQIGTNALINTFSVNDPSGVSYNKDGTKLFVLQYDPQTISVYSTVNYQLLSNISLSCKPIAMAISTDGTKIAVLSDSPVISDPDIIKIINTDTYQIVATLTTTGTYCDWITTDPVTGNAFVTSHTGTNNGTVQVLDFNTNTIKTSFNTVKYPIMVTTDTGGHLLVVGYTDPCLVMYSTSTYAQLAYTAVPVLGTGPQSVVTAGGNAYVGNYEVINVYTINYNSLTSLSQISAVSGAYVTYSANAILNPSNIPVTLQPQPIWFYVHSYYILRWNNVNLSAYNNAGQLIDSKITDNNGGATLQLTPGDIYTINAYSSALGINTTFTYTPPNSYSGNIQQGIMVIPFTSWLTGGSSGGMTNIGNQQASNYTAGQNPSGYQDRDIFLDVNASLVGTTGTVIAEYSDNSNLTSMVFFTLQTQNVNGTSNNISTQTVTLPLITNATLFDGAASYVDITPSGGVYNTVGGYSVEALIDTTVRAGTLLIYSEGNSGTSTPGFNIFLLNGVLTVTVRTDGNTVPLTCSSGLNLADGEPHRVSWTENNGAYVLYVDGDLIKSGTYTRAATTLNRFTIGANGRTNYQNFFNGKICDVRLWTTVRTQAGIQTTLYNRLTGSESGLKAYYKLDEGTGTAATDITSNHYTGTINSGTWNNLLWPNKATKVFTVNDVNANYKDFIITVTGVNSYYGNVSRVSPISFHVRSLLPGIPEQWHTYLAVIVVIGLFAASVMWLNGIMGLVGAGATYIFYSLGWLDTVPGAALGVTGAVVAAIVYYWSRRETGGLE